MTVDIEQKRIKANLGLPFAQLEDQIRDSLEDIGIENIGLIIFSDLTRPALKVIENISPKIKLSELVENNLEAYLRKSLQNEKKVIHQDIDYLIEQPIFNHDKLTISDSFPNLYSICDKINYGLNVTILLHSFNLLGQVQMTKLRLIVDIAIAWANSWVSHQKLLNIWEHLAYSTNQAKMPQLTSSEFDVFNLLIKGWTCGEVANIRRVSRETVRSQIKSILHKTQCNNQNQLIARYGHSQWFSSTPFGTI